MKVADGTVKISGFGSSQRFVPVQADTGILASSGSVRVTGAGTDVTVIEIHELHGCTVESPTYAAGTSQDRQSSSRTL